MRLAHTTNRLVERARLVSRRAVAPGEVGALVVSSLCVFAILAAYYVLKPLRSYVLQTRIGVDHKSSALVGSALFVTVQSLAYGRIVSRTTRSRLVHGTFLFALACLASFGVLLTSVGGRVVGYLFYAWVSGVSLLLVSQFWSLTTEAWTHEQGVRLFGLIGIGAVSGSIGGNLIVVALAKRLGTVGLFLVAGALLGVALGLARWILVWSRADRRPSLAPDPTAASVASASLVAASPYLAGIAGMSLLLNVVNTSNEWLLDKVVASASLDGASLQTFYGRYMLEQNVLTFALQIAVTSPIQRRFGTRVALLVLPTVSILGGLAFVVAPTLGVIRTLKVAENAAEYSIHANTRELLYVPVTSLERYSAKSFNDTFVVRAGDSIAAGAIYLVIEATGADLVRTGMTFVAALAVGLATVAMLVVWQVTARHRARVAVTSDGGSGKVH